MSFPTPSRRDILQAGALPLLGLTLPQLLASPTPAHRPARARSCIFIFQYGGLSQLDSWDPKPDGPTAIRGPYKPIATSVPCFRVAELMPRLARLAHRYAVIRSMSHGVGVHDVANRMLLAGQSKPPPLSAPSFGAIVSRLRPAREGLPSHVWLQKFGGGAMPPEATNLTGGSLGAAHSPLLVGNTHDDHPANPAFRVRAFDAAPELTGERVEGRLRLLGRMEQQRGPGAGDQLSRLREKAAGLLSGSKARQAFDVSREPARVRERYGMHPMGQNLLLARRLIEAGVRLVSVVAWCGLAPTDKRFFSIETWDMHGNADVPIFGNGWNGLGWALPCCDQSVSALLEDLHTRGLLDETLVVLVGEFGRTPRISKGGSAIGRDHWPNCYSAMLAGAGVRGGAVYGASDTQAAYVKDNLVSPEDFTATLFHALGVAPETPVSQDGFSVRASTGKPVLALF
jgi:uncharacterized protein (DUF1501 family)